jgi:hypothetical protein
MIFSENRPTLNTILSSDLMINSRYDIVSNFNKLNTYASETSAGLVQLAYQTDVENGQGDAFISPELLRLADLTFAPKLNFDLTLSGATPNDSTSAWCTNVKYVNDALNSLSGNYFDSFLRKTASDEPDANTTYQLGGDGVNLNTSYTNRWSGIFANTFYGTATQAQYADVAEKYLTKDKTLEIGELVSIDSNVSDPESEIVRTDASNMESCIGVISHRPGLILRSQCPGIEVALLGRTPVNVRGPISKGQKIKPSQEPGIAVAATPTDSGSIGFALERITSNDIYKIMCLIK